MLILLIIVWLTIGALGFIYWWTTEYDLKWWHLPVVAFAATIGPLAWLVGWGIHGKHEAILIRKRT